MEHTIAKYRPGPLSRLDNRGSLGHTMDSDQSIIFSRRTNVDTLDIAPFKGGSADEPVLESINAPCIFMYADIRGMALVGNVV